MANIRVATEVDLPWLVETGKKFNNKFYYVPLCPAKAEAFLRAAIVNPNGVIFRSDEGFIGGWLTEDPMRDWLVFVEHAWFSEGRDGMELLKVFEDYGRMHHVDEIRMTTLSTYPLAETMLAARGYKAIETSHRLLI